jgi:predicted transcriptional regulator of viral defense system
VNGSCPAPLVNVCAKTYLFDTLEHMNRPIFDVLVETASDHHGYVTTLQAREVGVDPTQLRLLAGRGRLEHVARGVYRVPVLPRSEHDDLAFAVAWARGRSVISHESALVLHRLSDVNPSVVHLTAPPDNFPRAKGGGPVRVHRRDLPAADVTMVDRLPVTTVARTIVDCYELGTDPAQLRLAIGQARQSGELRSAQAGELERLVSHQAGQR